MPFFHLPWRTRTTIAVWLLLNILLQLINEILQNVYYNGPNYYEQPQGIISLLFGPIGGLITGAVAGAVQLVGEGKVFFGGKEFFMSDHFGVMAYVDQSRLHDTWPRTVGVAAGARRLQLKDMKDIG